MISHIPVLSANTRVGKSHIGGGAAPLGPPLNPPMLTLIVSPLLYMWMVMFSILVREPHKVTLLQCHFMHWLCFLRSINYLQWSSKYGTLMMLVRVGSCLIFVCGGTKYFSMVHLLVIFQMPEDMACGIKPQFLEQACSLFADSLVNVTADGRANLGLQLGPSLMLKTGLQVGLTFGLLN